MLKHKVVQFLVGLLLIQGGCSSESKLFSILEHSLTETESKECDLVFLGQDLTQDRENDLQRPLIISSAGSTNFEHVLTKSLFAMTNCLILSISEEYYSLNDMMDLMEKFHFIKPVGVVYETKKEWKNLTGDIKRRSWPFPIMLQQINGKTGRPSSASYK